MKRKDITRANALSSKKIIIPIIQKTITKKKTAMYFDSEWYLKSVKEKKPLCAWMNLAWPLNRCSAFAIQM